MPVLHDYECARCRSIFEQVADATEKTIPCPRCHEGRAERVYLRMSALPGRNKGRYPVFDTQLGITVESSQHRDRVAKERGLVPMGVEEFNRSRNNAHENHPLDSDEVDPELIECAKRAWDDVKFDRVPHLDAPPDVSKIEADVLNVNSTVKPSA